METEGKRILVNYLTDIADTFRSITGETDLIDARTYPTEIEKVAGGSSSKNSYQRGSIEEMNAITDASDGDRCLILKETESNIVKDKKVRRLSFPSQVVMESPIKQFYIAVLETEEGTYGDINLSNTDFTFSLMDNSSSVDVIYSSIDGITYNRDTLSVDGNFVKIDENTIDFGTNILISDTNEYIGAFLLESITVCDGIYVKNGTNWSVQGLGYEISPENVEASVKYYNNGVQVGMLGNTETSQGVQKLNDFIKKYGTDFVYPKDISRCFSNYEGERIPLLELNPNTSNVTNMEDLFSGCCFLKSIPAMNTQNVTNMSMMFFKCEKLSSVPALNTSNVTNMNQMFNNCKSLSSVPALDTSNVTEMSGMFASCHSLVEIPTLNTSNVTNMGLMFVGCESLTTVPLLNTSNVTEMSGMFSDCHSLVEIPALDTSKGKYLAAMFTRCSSLKQIPLLNTKSCIHINGMFEGCTSLETVPILDASNVDDISKIFKDCPSLVMLGGLKNLGMNYSSAYYIHANKREYTLDLSYSPLLTHDSLMNVINNLYDIKSKGVKTQTLQLGDTNKAKLTAEEIAIATNKGWDVK